MNTKDTLKTSLNISDSDSTSLARRLAMTGSFWFDIIKDSLWHFNPGQSETIAVRRLCIANIEEFLKLIQLGADKTLDSSMQNATSADKISGKIKDDIRALAGTVGYPQDMVYALVTDCFASGHARADELGAALGLHNCYIKVHCQKPGQIWPLHVDNFHAFRNHSTVSFDERRIRRYAIALSDWCWGQMFQIGNAIWTNWSIGDCVEIPRGVPHSTANASPFDRLSLILTGIE